MQTLTESMFYLLMALSGGEKTGVDIAEHVETRTNGRIKLGPATLYALLQKFEKERIIEIISQQSGRKVYKITQKGLDSYAAERERMWACLFDAEEEEKNGK